VGITFLFFDALPGFRGTVFDAEYYTSLVPGKHHRLARREICDRDNPASPVTAEIDPDHFPAVLDFGYLVRFPADSAHHLFGRAHPSAALWLSAGAKNGAMATFERAQPLHDGRAILGELKGTGHADKYV